MQAIGDASPAKNLRKNPPGGILQRIPGRIWSVKDVWKNPSKNLSRYLSKNP